MSTTGALAGTLGLIQPFRYRGYVYDYETGFYYLQSRYYDPTVGRFISADVLLSTGQGVMGHNCYAYCLGNPVNMRDDSGSIPQTSQMEADQGMTPEWLKHIYQIIQWCNENGIAVYCSADEAAVSVAPNLYYKTMETNNEYMAAIYTIDYCCMRLYCAGPIYSGGHDNVIEPTLISSNLDTLGISGCFSKAGFVHSHPYCNGHEYGVFSDLIGDQGAAYLTGSCYMVDPKKQIAV